MFFFSSHLPISVTLCFTCPNVEDTEEEILIDKIVWDENKTEQLTNSIQTNITELQNLIDSITNNDVDLNTGIEQFSDVLYRRES